MFLTIPRITEHFWDHNFWGTKMGYYVFLDQSVVHFQPTWGEAATGWEPVQWMDSTTQIGALRSAILTAGNHSKSAAGIWLR